MAYYNPRKNGVVKSPIYPKQPGFFMFFHCSHADYIAPPFKTKSFDNRPRLPQKERIIFQAIDVQALKCGFREGNKNVETFQRKKWERSI